MEIEALEGLGLTRNEAVVYLTLLEGGRCHIGQISEKTKMHRRTIYDCLERLQDKGLVNFIVEGKTRFFNAVNPQKLKEIATEKETKIEEILPKLMEMAKRPKARTEATVHSGKEGLKNIMEDILRTKPNIWLSLTSAGKVTEKLPFYVPKFHEKRVKARIKLNIIFGKSESAIKRAEELKKLDMTDIKFIDTNYVIPISIWVYNNKLAFMLWDSELGILIESKDSVDSFKQYFNLLWKLAKK